MFDFEKNKKTKENSPTIWFPRKLRKINGKSGKHRHGKIANVWVLDTQKTRT